MQIYCDARELMCVFQRSGQFIVFLFFHFENARRCDVADDYRDARRARCARASNLVSGDALRRRSFRGIVYATMEQYDACIQFVSFIQASKAIHIHLLARNGVF